MGIRKNAAHLTATERDNFLRAVLTLKNTIANPAAPVAQRISIYDQFAAVHLYATSVNVPAGGAPINMGHQNSGFCPWHRYYILQFEQALQAVDPTVSLPYWDWTDHTATQTLIFQNNFMGPNGGPGGAGGGNIQSGYFAFNAPVALPVWWPAGLAGWRVKTQLQQGHGGTVQRGFGAFAALEIQANVQTCLNKNNYENPSGFRQYLESGAAGLNMHNGMHSWVGGNMGDNASSANDVIFFLHHCNIDRLWAMWQIDSHQGMAFYPAAGRPEGHNLNNLMWPWVAATPDYSSNNVQPDIILPDFAAQPSIRPLDVLDHRVLGYAYDSEVIMGIALDQTGSMNGLTPDPMTGMAPNIPKWDAAKSGVSALLHDCEVAYTAKEAYVIAGVETFRTLGVNTFTQIFPGAHFGMVKNTGVITQAIFEANIMGQLPSGGTPLAGALTDTDTSLVRAPFANLPAGEQRYLSILTDGKETASPLLSSLGLHAFPNTIIFGMGFGIGGGWDGVDYATIATMTTKGKTARPGVTQVYHGENAGVIDKFYSDSVAASMGFNLSVDPVFDLYPGENVHLNFDVTDADQVFMITAQGFDFSDKNWAFCLMAPDGSHCGDTRSGGAGSGEGTAGHSHGGSTDVLAPFLVTMNQNKGRCTIFLNRNGVESHHWVGRWAIMAFYKADPDNHVMIMPSISDLILPTGAPPVKGPLYSRIFQSPEKRLPVRAIGGKMAHALAIGLPGITTTSPEPPCAVSINIYNKTSHEFILDSEVKTPFAGEDIVLSLNLSDAAGGSFSIHTFAARLVAPNHSLGNAFADLKTIPLARRKKFINRQNVQEPFDVLRYLAEYERLNPTAFPTRDEIVEFAEKDDGSWAALIKNNRFPGIYRVALYVEGIYNPKEQDHEEHCCTEEPQRFSKVLQTVIALGIKPDEKKSNLKIQWVASNRFIVSVTPMDITGNIILPLAGISPVVILNEIAITSKIVNEYTGEYKMDVSFLARDLVISSDGTTVQEGEAVFETLSGEKLVLKKGDKIKIGVQIKDSILMISNQKYKK
ncbi:MAG: tyrosinase family protein [Ferruginibacter sp.]